MKRFIKSANEPATQEDILNDALRQLKDDFDYAVDGISKLAADGDMEAAQSIANTLSEMINGSIEEVAEGISSEG